MRRFKDLSKEEKKRAIDIVLKDKMTKGILNEKDIASDRIKDKLNKIRTDMKFCGCTSCFNKYLTSAGKDSEVKEYFLSEAQQAAENAYYPDTNELVIKV